MNHLSPNDLFEIFAKDADKNVKGWDWSHISDRHYMEPLPWAYRSIVIPFVRTSQFMLDMGTGGGELLSSLGPFPEYTCATESYKPNIVLAKMRLQPLGIHLKSYEKDDQIPFDTESFDLIINKHESFNTIELERLMIPRGYFVTQQVGDQDNIELNKLLGDTKVVKKGTWNVDYASKELIKAGFEVHYREEAFPKTRFYDIGAVLFYLNAVPWQIVDYSFEKYRESLYNLHEVIQEKGFIEVQSHRFIIIAQEE